MLYQNEVENLPALDLSPMSLPKKHRKGVSVRYALFQTSLDGETSIVNICKLII